MSDSLNPENICKDLDISEQAPATTLIDLFAKQQHLQETLQVAFTSDSTLEQTKIFMKNMNALISELYEAQDRLPWKFWRNYPADTALSEDERTELHYELADVLFFYLNLCLSLKLDPQRLYELYYSKWEENMDRIARGYSKGNADAAKNR